MDTPIINLKTKLVRIGKWRIIKLNKEVSSKLSSRGIAMIKGTLNNIPFQTALEPDGKGSHWFKVDKHMRQAIGIEVGDTVELSFEQTREWPEPNIPLDLQNALSSSPKSYTVWKEITPFTRWEWVRWIRATKNEETRARRISKAMDMLNKGKKRPCCFNSNQCTVQPVSNNGILLDPTTL